MHLLYTDVTSEEITEERNKDINGKKDILIS